MAEPIRNVVTGKTMASGAIEVAPGKYIGGEVKPADVPRYGLVRMVRQGDGSYLPVLKTFSSYPKLPGLAEQLGIEGLSQRTLERLVQTGFVECVRVTPQVNLVNLDSLFAHLVAARDPEFWTAARRAQFGKGWKS